MKMRLNFGGWANGNDGIYNLLIWFHNLCESHVKSFCILLCMWNHMEGHVMYRPWEISCLIFCWIVYKWEFVTFGNTFIWQK
jgi:hypothetical protein